ncbi:MAG: DUF2235 domain-containing protein [Pseudomonadota bacterium]
MPAKKSKSRTLVVLCDGTSNEIKADRTNVLRLFQCVDTSAGNVVFYDPGVGTVGAYSNWNRWWIKAKELLGLAFGKGLDDNVLDAYQFLINNWQEGDRIYLFGFSRGAYTVRVLAGLVYTIGILRPEQENLKRYALNTLKNSSLEGDFENLLIYQETLNRKPVEIEFIGMWDTVSSVFTWLKGMFRIKNIGYTRRNHAIKTVRHALAIDERRRFYVHYDWLPGQSFTTHLPHTDEYKNGVFPPQDATEVWFAGAHTDSGGGYRDEISQVPKIAFKWLVEEADKAGLALDQQKVEYFLGEAPDEDGNYLTKPDPKAPLYKSLFGLWWLLEICPKWRNFEWSNPVSWLDFYIPLGERRTMTNHDASDDTKVLIHTSVKIRMDETQYNPPNLPEVDKIDWV